MDFALAPEAGMPALPDCAEHALLPSTSCRQGADAAWDGSQGVSGSLQAGPSSFLPKPDIDEALEGALAKMKDRLSGDSLCCLPPVLTTHKPSSAARGSCCACMCQ